MIQQKICSFLVLTLLVSFNSFTQNGRIIEGLPIYSSILDTNVAYSIYLPHNYDSSQQTYPAFYLLHGNGDDEKSWAQLGNISFIADQAIASGVISPMVIVMPNAFKSYYINSYDSVTLYEDFFFTELIPYLENKFRLKQDRKYRAVGGHSMGGYGAFLYGLKHASVFAAAIPLSAAIRSDEDMMELNEKFYDNVYGPLYGRNKKGKERLTSAWYKASVLNIIENNSPDSMKSVRWYIDCGDDDLLSLGNVAAHAALKRKGISHQFRIRDGAHNWDYWRLAMPSVLQFVDEGFRN